MNWVRALVWRRSDFRESSRLVTLLTRERGKLTALAKGAHRPRSALLGRLDFLNLLRVELRGRGLPLIGRTELLEEPRGLREPQRFLLANHVVSSFDQAWLEGREDPELFDLLEGSIKLLSRAPDHRLGLVLAGIELRLLTVLGQLPPLDRCSSCDRELGRGQAFVASRSFGMHCARHRPPGASTVLPLARETLTLLLETPGGRWHTMPAKAQPALKLLGHLLTAALERPPRDRDLALLRLERASSSQAKRLSSSMD